MCFVVIIIVVLSECAFPLFLSFFPFLLSSFYQLFHQVNESINKLVQEKSLSYRKHTWARVHTHTHTHTETHTHTRVRERECTHTHARTHSHRQNDFFFKVQHTAFIKPEKKEDRV